MNRAEVTRLARGKFGKAVEVTENARALDPETRAILKRDLEKIKTEEPQPPPECVEFHRRHWEWRQQRDRVRGLVLSGKRYRIAENWGLGIHVVGQGDTWEEAARQAGLLTNNEPH